MDSFSNFSSGTNEKKLKIHCFAVFLNDCWWFFAIKVNRPYFPRHLKSLKLRSIRRCYEQAATLHGRIQTGRRQAGD